MIPFDETIAGIKNTVNRQRLIDCLEREFERNGDEHFNLSNVLDVCERYDDEGKLLPFPQQEEMRFSTVKDLHTCGSTACAIGIWNTYHPQEQLVMLNCESSALCDERKDGSVTHIYDWLDMDIDACRHLFGYAAFWYYPYDGVWVKYLSEKVTLKHMIEALKNWPDDGSVVFR